MEVDRNATTAPQPGTAGWAQARRFAFRLPWQADDDNAVASQSDNEVRIRLSPRLTFRILGIRVTIGPGIVAGLLVLGVLSGLSGAFLAEWVAFGILALLFHELGHALAFRRYGVVSSITFWVLGGFTMADDQDLAERLCDRQMLVVSLAGPAVGLLLGLAGLALGLAFAAATRSVRAPIFWWTYINLAWAIFNLLPITALDGGRALQHLAGAIFGRAGRALALVFGIVASALIAVVAVRLGLWSIAFIAVVFGLVNPAAYSQLMDELRPDRATGGLSG